MAHLAFVETTRPGIQALDAARRLGHRVTFVTSHKFDWMLPEADKVALRERVDQIVEVQDTHRVDLIEAGLAERLGAGPIDAVLSTLHQMVAPAAQAAQRLGLRATSVQGIMNARDKPRCRELLTAHGIPSVRYRAVDSVEAALDAIRETGYPAIIKPATGMAKVLAGIVHNDEQVREHFRSAAQRYSALNPGVKDEITLRFIVEEIARGPLYSIEVGASAHGEWMPFVILKRKVGKHNPILELGSTIPSDLDERQYEAAASYSTRIAQLLGLDLGIFHIEFVYTAEGPRLVEVNPRIAGGHIPDLIRTATGKDLFELLVRIYSGERIGLGKLECKTASSHSFIAAFEDCVIRPDLPKDWFDAFRPRISSGYSDIRAGQSLRKMDGNYDVYGVVRVTADHYVAAEQQTEQLRTEIGSVLGVPLVEVVD